MAVPTHFYKVVLAESKSKIPFGSSKVSVGAFVMPNDQIQPDMPLTAFTVPLEMLEDVAGATMYSTAGCCNLYWLTSSSGGVCDAGIIRGVASMQGSCVCGGIGFMFLRSNLHVMPRPRYVCHCISLHAVGPSHKHCIHQFTVGSLLSEASSSSAFASCNDLKYMQGKLCFPNVVCLPHDCTIARVLEKI